MIADVMACSMILFGCAYMGILLASSFKKRVIQLEEFQHIMKQLEFDIDFINTPLHKSLKRLGNMCDGGVRDVVLYVSRELSISGCVDMKCIWQKALERFESELAFNGEDKRIILDFASNLGCGDRIREKNNIKAALMRLEVAVNEARAQAVTNVKMYRGLGVLTGIFIVIVLL